MPGQAAAGAPARGAAVVWLLDVDGVLAPFARTDPDTQVIEVGFEDHGSLVLNPTLNARIATLVADSLVEARWLTAWEDDANRLLAARVGLPPLRTYESAPSAGWWKADVVDAVLATEPVRVVFADDEMNDWTDSDGRPIRQALTSRWGDRVLLLVPDPLIGLTAEHLDQVEDFIG